MMRPSRGVFGTDVSARITSNEQAMNWVTPATALDWRRAPPPPLPERTSTPRCEAERRGQRSGDRPEAHRKNNEGWPRDTPVLFRPAPGTNTKPAVRRASRIAANGEPGESGPARYSYMPVALPVSTLARRPSGRAQWWCRAVRVRVPPRTANRLSLGTIQQGPPGPIAGRGLAAIPGCPSFAPGQR